MPLRCEVSIPIGYRHARLFVRLEQPEETHWTILPARNFAEATHQVVNVGGIPLLTYLTENDPGVSAELDRQGYRGLGESLELVHAIHPGHRVVIVGGHFGYQSVLSALLAGSEGVVDSFEPDAANAALLHVNALLAQQIFPESAPIRICASAVVSDRPGLSRLYRSDRNPSEHTLLPTPDAIQTQVVPSTSLDDWRFDAAADTKPVRVLAIDIVGGELAVVEGAERLLQQDRPVLIVRLRAAVSGIDACCQLIDRLATWGYRRLRLARPVAPEPYVLLSDSLRLFAVAELADHLRRKIVGPDLTLVAHSVPHS